MYMYFYFVWVRSHRYHGSEPLTYASQTRLPAGSIVQVELQKELVLGVVIGPTTQPRFKTKPISRVFDLPPLPSHLIKVSQWLQQYYPAPLGILAQQLLPVSFSEKQLIEQSPTEIESDIEAALAALPPLTSQQSAALEAMQERNSYILHGTTGSGKTRLYTELAAQTVRAGKSAIILTPEISLTTQLAGTLRGVFGERVVVMHSQQTPAERQHAWLTCLRATTPIILVGPRSALFSPLKRLGLIVMDEAHEAAYKQEQAPQYQSGRVAAYLASQVRASLILGSATPAVSDYYVALQKQKPIIRLDQLAQAGRHPASSVMIVDRKDHDHFSRSPHFSLPLIEAVSASLNRGEQSLLYLNRRGTARLILCNNCGWQADCPHCDVPLTYHGDSHSLRCHSCNYQQSAPTSCPTCGETDIVFRTAGTKAIVDEVERLFPGARVGRFDTDNLKADRFETQYDNVKAGKVDILVGTQLLAKGLDLPRLSTLGVLLADTSLYMPDFTAHERTFQLLSQVLGRVGRGHVAGTAVIQTYHPDHPIIQAAIAGDYQTFYAAEIASRQQFRFPPFVYMLKLSVRKATSNGAQSAATKLKHVIETEGYKVRVEGPAPCFYERFQNKYQWQLVVKAGERSELLRLIQHLPAGWSYDIDPIDLL